jgi:hypothetical protein
MLKDRFYMKTHRSAQGMRAMPDRQKHVGSPSNLEDEPIKAIGPHRSNQFSLLLPTSLRDIYASSLNDILKWSSLFISTRIVSLVLFFTVALIIQIEIWKAK